MVQGHVQKEIFNVKGKESGMWGGNSGIDEELGGCEVHSRCLDVPGVVNVVPTHGKASMVGFCFLQAIVNNNLPTS